MRPEIGKTGQRAAALNGGRGQGRGIDTSLTASGSVYMNERPKLGSEPGGMNVHLWVFFAGD
jgi:hypothetical protein